MVKEDTAQVQQVAHQTWHTTYEGIIPIQTQKKFLSTAYSDERMEQRLNHSLLIVAEVENKIVGFANYSPANEEGEVELSAIYIHPEHQGKGIGTALLIEGINSLEGVRKIYINVEKENKIGRNFYEAKGFKVIEEFDDHFDGHILKTVRMVLEV